MGRNYELAELLIETAEELLNEGAQLDEYKQKKIDERIKQRRKNRERIMDVAMAKDGTNSKVYNAYTRLGFSGYDPSKKRSITKAEKNGLDEKKALEHERKMKDIAQKASQITRKEAYRRNEIAKNSGEGYYDANFDSDYLTAMDATNRHIRRHMNKPQNESIADLLIEAAELLSEYDD